MKLIDELRFEAFVESLPYSTISILPAPCGTGKSYAAKYYISGHLHTFVVDHDLFKKALEMPQCIFPSGSDIFEEVTALSYAIPNKPTIIVSECCYPEVGGREFRTLLMLCAKWKARIILMPQNIVQAKYFKDTIKVVQQLENVKKPVGSNIYANFYRANSMEVSEKSYFSRNKNDQDELIEKSLEYVNSLSSPYEKLVKLNKVYSLIIKVINSTCSFILFIIFLPTLFVSERPMEKILDWLSDVSEESNFSGEFEKMFSTLRQLDSGTVKGLEYFTQNIASPINYDLFYRIKTWKLDSFLEADRQNNRAMLRKIVAPLVWDIISEARETYQKHLDFEAMVKQQDDDRLDKLMKVDDYAYKNRIFKD